MQPISRNTLAFGTSADGINEMTRVNEASNKVQSILHKKRASADPRVFRDNSV
jgi:hypothetical protein